MATFHLYTYSVLETFSAHQNNGNTALYTNSIFIDRSRENMVTCVCVFHSQRTQLTCNFRGIRSQRGDAFTLRSNRRVRLKRTHNKRGENLIASLGSQRKMSCYRYLYFCLRGLISALSDAYGNVDERDDPPAPLRFFNYLPKAW